MGQITTVLDKLITLVQGVQYSSDTAFVDVLDYPTSDFNGYPTAIVMLQDGDSEFSTNQSYQRTDTFAIHIIVMIEDSGLTPKNAVRRVYDLMESTMDTIDKDPTLTGSVLHLLPSTGGVTIDSISSGLVARGVVNVRATYLFDLVP